MQNDLIHIDPSLLAKWNRPVPRYTSYPTAPQFAPQTEELFKEKLAAFDASTKPLSLYLHIPFCKTMCLFCACSVVLNRKPEKQASYFSHLLREIELVAANFSGKRKVSQLHLGGGTPTSLTVEEFPQLIQKLQKHFTWGSEDEISIEVDPRTVHADGGVKLKLLKDLGFNRVSFGVQDLDPVVQEAIRRRQTEEMTVTTYEKARALGFEGINIDLIYGLPHQTVERFTKTIDRIIELKPDRIAFYSYAKVPWLKEHQKAIPDETLPSTEEKFRIYVTARARLMMAGYVAIGMDHFALAKDPMSKAYREGKLTRNFQGYSVQLADDMIGLGLTSIGFLENTYFQNIKDLAEYQECVASGRLATHRGFVLSEEDLIRRKAIQSLMCQFELDKRQFKGDFTGIQDSLDQLEKDGLIIQTKEKILPTPVGRLFIRLVASAFDAYLVKGQFSRAV